MTIISNIFVFKLFFASDIIFGLLPYFILWNMELYIEPLLSIKNNIIGGVIRLFTFLWNRYSSFRLGICSYFERSACFLLCYPSCKNDNSSYIFHSHPFLQGSWYPAWLKDYLLDEDSFTVHAFCKRFIGDWSEGHSIKIQFKRIYFLPCWFIDKRH